MDTDDDVSTFEEEEASLSETENIFSGVGLGLSSESDTIGLEDGEESCLEGIHLKQDILLAANAEDERVKFQVMCAHTEVSDVEKYVVYTIDIERGEDNRPALLERRYTDFLSLYRSLKHSYPALMSHIKFPRKEILKSVLLRKEVQDLKVFFHMYTQKMSLDVPSHLTLFSIVVNCERAAINCYILNSSQLFQY
ncbi:Sorting nexin-21 [Armadillidium nasatum]|uniref:Sorting nexin-21 n=1 Tax=Armadillidium nasatum TaxID=96803 RepID=A0A5N5T8Q6_9CRUS|nr:Sorting nexin-21 [Armadillidium nasatum]